MTDARPARRSDRAVVVVGLVAVAAIVVGATVAPAWLRRRREEKRRERAREIVQYAGAQGPGKEETDRELVELADDVVPDLLKSLKKNESALPLLTRTWELGALKREQRNELVAALSRLSVHAHAPVFLEKEEKSLFIDTHGPAGFKAGFGRARGTLEVTVGGKVVATETYEGPCNERERPWDKQKHVDLKPSTLAPGVHKIGIRLTVRVTPAAAEEAEAVLEQPTEIEVIPGDWRAAIDAVDTREAAALAKENVDVAFGLWPDFVRDIHVTAGDKGPVAYWTITKKPLPFWICHSVFVELEGKELVPGGECWASPGEEHPLPKDDPHGGQGFFFKIEKPPGRYPIRVRLRPSPKSVLGYVKKGEKLKLYGGELAFDRLLIVEKAR